MVLSQFWFDEICNEIFFHHIHITVCSLKNIANDFSILDIKGPSGCLHLCSVHFWNTYKINSNTSRSFVHQFIIIFIMDGVSVIRIKWLISRENNKAMLSCIQKYCMLFTNTPVGIGIKYNDNNFTWNSPTAIWGEVFLSIMHHHFWTAYFSFKIPHWSRVTHELVN